MVKPDFIFGFNVKINFGVKTIRLLVNDGRVSKSINSLEHRCNVVCVSLFYCYYNGFYSCKIRTLVFENHVFLGNTRLSGRTHRYVIDWPVNCFADISFFYPNYLFVENLSCTDKKALNTEKSSQITKLIQIKYTKLKVL